MDIFDNQDPRMVSSGRRAGKARLTGEAYAAQGDLVMGFEAALPAADARLQESAVVEMHAGETEAEEPRAPQRCKGGCGFFASANRQGYCSTCVIPGTCADDDITPAPAAAAPVHGRRAAGQVC